MYVVTSAVDVLGPAAVGGPVAPVPAISVTADGQPAAGLRVVWSAEDGGTVQPAISTTDARGRASTEWTLGPAAGVQHVVASVAGATVRLTAQAVSAGVARLALAQRALKLADVGDSVALAALATDRYGNAIAAPALAWSTLSPTVASVSQAGLVRGLAEGSARIVVSSAGYADTATVEVAHPPASLVVSPREITFPSLGVAAPVSAVVKDRRGEVMQGQPVQWSSSDTAVAVVSSIGIVAARGNGRAAIYARMGSLVDSASVLVSQVVASVKVTPANTQLAMGDSVRLAASASDTLGNPVTGGSWTWASDNATVATVDASGLARAVGPGSATITARTGSVTGAARVTVTDTRPGTLRLSPHAATLHYLLAKLQLTAAYYDASGAYVPDAPITYSIRAMPDSAALVSPTGLVTEYIGMGTAVVVATCGSSRDSAIITLQQVPATPMFLPDSLVLHVGEKALIEAVAGDSAGWAIFPMGASFGGYAISTELLRTGGLVVTAVTVGRTDLAITVGTAYAHLIVRVLAPPSGATSVRLSPHNATLHYLGENLQLAATAYDAAGNALPGEYIQYSTPDWAVKVSTSGMVTQAARWGTARVIAAAGSGRDSALITVQQVPVGRFLLPDSLILHVGESATIGFAARDSGGAPIYPTGASYGGSQISALAQGDGVVVTGLSVGRVVLSLTVGTAYVDLPVRVIPAAPPAAVASVRLNRHAGNLNYLNATLQLTATAYDAAGNPLPGAVISYTTAGDSPPGVVSVMPNGLVTQVLHWGSANVVASSGAASDTALISVRQAVARMLLPDTLLVHVGEMVVLGGPAARDSGGSAIYSNSSFVPWLETAIIKTSAEPDGLHVTGMSVGLTAITLYFNQGELLRVLPVKVVAATSSGSAARPPAPVPFRAPPRAPEARPPAAPPP